MSPTIHLNSSQKKNFIVEKADRLVVTELETSMYEKPKVDNQTIVSDLLLGNILVKKGEKASIIKLPHQTVVRVSCLRNTQRHLRSGQIRTYDFKTIEKNA